MKWFNLSEYECGSWYGYGSEHDSRSENSCNMKQSCGLEVVCGGFENNDTNNDKNNEIIIKDNDKKVINDILTWFNGGHSG